MDIREWLDRLDEQSINLQIGAVYYVSETGAWQIRESLTEYTEIVQVTSGSFSYRLDGIHYIVSEGEMLLIPAGCLRSVLNDPARPTECYIVFANFPDSDGRESNLRSPLICHTGLDEDLLRQYAELNLDWIRKLPGFNMKCRAHLLMICNRYYSLCVLRQLSGVQDPRIEQAVYHIVRNYARPLHVTDLSSIVGLNPVYFGTLFKAGTGFSVKAFINRVRIGNAETLIIDGGFSIEAAARRCGFDDVFYFSKVFKRLRGYPPSRIRHGKSPSKQADNSALDSASTD